MSRSHLPRETAPRTESTVGWAAHKEGLSAHKEGLTRWGPPGAAVRDVWFSSLAAQGEERQALSSRTT